MTVGYACLSVNDSVEIHSMLTYLLIEKVYVFPDKRIEIVYKIYDVFE